MRLSVWADIVAWSGGAAAFLVGWYFESGAAVLWTALGFLSVSALLSRWDGYYLRRQLYDAETAAWLWRMRAERTWPHEAPPTEEPKP